MDYRDEKTLAALFHRKRFFLELVKPIPKPMTILDLGGEQRFWEVMNWGSKDDFHFTIINIYPPEITLPNFCGVVGDATNLGEFSRQEFDFVFSNSVIEHLGSYVNQEQMASEVRRLGMHYFIQTPNKFFPLEPHFLFPYFQFLPFQFQVAMIQQFNLGWYQRIPEKDLAIQHIRSHRLLIESEMRAHFPGGRIYKEKVIGLTKSFIAFGPGE